MSQAKPVQGVLKKYEGQEVLEAPKASKTQSSEKVAQRDSGGRPRSRKKAANVSKELLFLCPTRGALPESLLGYFLSALDLGSFGVSRTGTSTSLNGGCTFCSILLTRNTLYIHGVRNSRIC